MNILIVEDDQFLAKNIIKQFHKYAPTNIIKHLSSYNDFLWESHYDIYDIILLDICLSEKPLDRSGLNILQHIRKTNTTIPIVVMSNIIQYSYLERAFEYWAQDYLIKPFRVRELQIRIQRWFHSYIFNEFYSSPKNLVYHQLEYSPSTNEFLYDNKKLELSKSSKYVLSLLLINKERLVTKQFLSEKIWWYSEKTENKNLRIKILRLKESIINLPLNSRIQTVRGEGYILQKIDKIK